MLKKSSSMLKKSPLGRKADYIQTYSPDLLYPIPRSLARKKIPIHLQKLPFSGVDIWNGYELSWLNAKGKPEIALAEFHFPCTTPKIIESKSFKLYLNALNQSSFASFHIVQEILKKDLSERVEGPVTVRLDSLAQCENKAWSSFEGTCLDALDIVTNTYQVDPRFLQTGSEHVTETLYSNLLKSNCLATGQPDWGSVLIRYSGRKIDREGLLKYIISYRNHSGFAEHCVEQLFVELQSYCQTEQLTVYARYTRRGGLDINPFRSNFEDPPVNRNIIRQ